MNVVHKEDSKGAHSYRAKLSILCATQGHKGTFYPFPRLFFFLSFLKLESSKHHLTLEQQQTSEENQLQIRISGSILGACFRACILT